MLTSGTLSPVPALAAEFSPLKFPYRLENGHVIGAKQVRMYVCMFVCMCVCVCVLTDNAHNGGGALVQQCEWRS